MKRSMWRAAAAVAFVIPLSGCSLGYLLHLGKGQASLYNREKPIAEVVKDSGVPERVREQLGWVAEIKKHVEAVLGVKATSNYETFVDLGRPYVIWSLTAAPKYELKLVQWNFPIVGGFPYLGFFDLDRAKEKAEELKKEGYDTHLRGVSAYSTLGYLRDPLLSSMLSGRKQDLVNLIFHETTHSYVYIKSEGAFNEQAASFVGDYGELEWILGTEGKQSEPYRLWYADREDRRALGTLLREFAEKLKAEFKNRDGGSLKPQLYSEFWTKLKTHKWTGRYKASVARDGGAFFERAFANNAAVLASLTYEDNQETFDLVYKTHQGRLKDALGYLKFFAENYKNIRSRYSAELSLPQVLKKELEK